MKNEKKLYFTKKPPWIGMLENAQDRPNMQPRPDWTKTAPTKPGYYWVRSAYSEGNFMPPVVRMLTPTGWLLMGNDEVFPATEEVKLKHMFGAVTNDEFWSKPIAPPEE